MAKVEGNRREHYVVKDIRSAREVPAVGSFFRLMEGLIAISKPHTIHDETQRTEIEARVTHDAMVIATTDGPDRASVNNLINIVRNSTHGNAGLASELEKRIKAAEDELEQSKKDK